MNTKSRLAKAEQAVNIVKPALDAVRLKPSEIAERIRVLLAKCPPSDYKEHILQRLKSLEQVNP